MKWIFLLAALSLSALQAFATEDKTYWMKIKATNKYERSAIANTGAVIEVVKDDYVIAFGGDIELELVRATKMLDTSFVYDHQTMDFPDRDSQFHDYNELVTALKKLQTDAPDIVAYEVIGKSIEGRDIINIRISTDLPNSERKPGISIVGTHHAREHLSTEFPLMLAQYLVSEFKNGNPEVQRLVRGREINIVPLVNPDGIEWDIVGGNYKAWRKNRRNNGDGSFGVDLNRNYSYQWGTTGTSSNPRSDVYKGTAPFSEPETMAIKTFLERKTNVTIQVSFHTFSELILYPWGWTYSPLENARDLQVHKTMAETMAQWNGYTPEQSSDLYTASGDTTDWAYAELKMISFTFEMDPKSAFGTDGFYPGQAKIPVVFNKNLKPCLYMIELADNPYRVIDGGRANYGLHSSIVR
ncbi:MAG: M14 family metallopeptidase [Bdellovibrionales bacterium]